MGEWKQPQSGMQLRNKSQQMTDPYDNLNKSQRCCSAEVGYIVFGSTVVEFPRPQIYGDQMLGDKSNRWQWGGLQGRIAMKISVSWWWW